MCSLHVWEVLFWYSHHPIAYSVPNANKAASNLGLRVSIITNPLRTLVLDLCVIYGVTR